MKVSLELEMIKQKEFGNGMLVDPMGRNRMLI